MSPRGLKTAKIKGLGASAVLRAPLRNPGVLTLLPCPFYTHTFKTRSPAAQRVCLQYSL